MSKSAVAFEMSPEELMKPIADMQSLMADMARTSPAARMMTPLMLHPTAASAAAMAVTFGAASQMMGFFMGSMQGAMESSRRMGLPTMPLDAVTGLKPMEPDWAKAAGKATVEAVADTVEIVRESVASTAREVSEVAANSRKDADAVVAKTTAAATTGSAVAAKKMEAIVKAAVPAAERVTPTRSSERQAAPIETAAPAKSARQQTAAKPVPTARKVIKPAMKAPEKAAKPEQPDDLKLISGVGPKLEEVLNKLGVWTYGQIAAWNEAEIAWVEDYLQFKGRIGRDGWIEQANALLKK